MNTLLAGIGQEGQPVDLSNPGEEKTETSQESPAEENQTEPSPSSDGGQASPDSNPKEKNVPFDQHPRWIERENEWKTRFKTLEEKLSAFEKAQESPAQPSIPRPFVDLYGDNPEAWKRWQELSRIEREAVKQELVQEQQREQQRKAQEAERWNSWVVDSVAKLAEKHGKEIRKDSPEWNELMKVTLDYSPTDEMGNISFEKGYDLMVKLRREESAEKSKARKSLASGTSPETKAEGAPKDFYTPADLRRGWNMIKN